MHTPEMITSTLLLSYYFIIDFNVLIQKKKERKIKQNKVKKSERLW